MTTRILFFVAALGLAGCAPEAGPVKIKTFMPSSPDCTPGDPAKLFSSRGKMDIAPGKPGFFLDIVVAGAADIHSAPVSVVGQNLEKADRENVVLDVITYTYATRPKKTAGFKTETENIRAVMAPDQFLIMNRNIIRPIASSVIDSTFTDVYTGAPEDTHYLDVTIEITGHMSGSGAPITTDAVVYPIEFIRSDARGVTCGADGFQLFGCQTRDCCVYDGQLTSPNFLCCDPAVGVAGCRL